MRASQTLRPRRSALYMPGANARALDKARTLDADVLILDLEDAVAPSAKDEARQQVCAALHEGGYGAREVVVRMNGLDTPWAAADMAALAALAPADQPDALLAPKISTSAEIDAVLADLPDGLDLWIMMETPLAIFNAAQLAARAADTPLRCFVMGTNDLAKQMRAEIAPGRDAMMTPLTLALLAARHYGLSALDGVFNDIADEAGLGRECQQGAAMGFDGKTLIHPSQLAPCNEIFAPSSAAVEEAEAIVAAFDDPANAGQGVLKVNGKMTELLHAEMARQTLAIAAAIAARKNG